MRERGLADDGIGVLIGIGLVGADEEEQHHRQDQREDHGPAVSQQPPDLDPEHGRVDPGSAAGLPGANVRDRYRRGAHFEPPGWLVLAWLAGSLSSLVKAMNASSSARAVISRSLAGVEVSRYRATASLSLAWISTESPRISALSAPWMARNSASSAFGKVARTVRPAV